MGIHGIDKTIIYDRVMQEFEISFKTYKSAGDFIIPEEIDKIVRKNKYYWVGHNFDLLKKNDYNTYAYFIIGFCGKYYIGFEFIESKDKIFDNVTSYITYDYEEIKSRINNIRKYGNKKTEHQRLEDFFNDVKNINMLDTFRKYNTPIFIFYKSDGGHYSNTPARYCKNYFVVNPRLKDYEFYKIFDPFTCFQEISMFMGGVLGSKEKEIIEVADKYKIQQHGFDYKWSFRNPDPPKRKQKNNK